MFPLTLIAGVSAVATSAQMAATHEFGRMPDGRPVTEVTLRNHGGSEARILSYGATLRALKVPDRTGRLTDVVLGFDDLESYLKYPNFGSIVGRFANRIARAEFQLDGHTYHLDPNSEGNTLHGGKRGLGQVLWSIDERHERYVRLRYVSPDGEGGFPGRVTVSITYTLTDANELTLEYVAVSTANTVVNFTNHTYFSLGGQGRTDAIRESIQVAADRYTPVNSDLIPTGEIASVGNTEYDFRRLSTLASRAMNGMYDVNLILADSRSPLKQAATVLDPQTGIELSVLTTEPALQLFTPDFPVGLSAGKGGKSYSGPAAVCLETQHFPDSPHHPGFPTTLLEAAKTFRSTTIYRFSVSLIGGS
jgi:aldose 1-epimerase